MTNAYRASASPATPVPIGPFPPDPLLLVLALVLGVVGLVVVGVVGRVLAAPRPHAEVTCARADDDVTCTETRGASVRTLSGPVSGVHELRGRTGSGGLVVGGDFFPGVSREHIERVRALGDGQHVTFDATEGVPVGATVAGAAFALMVFVLAGWLLVASLRRTRRVDVLVTPSSLDVGAATVARGSNESLELVLVSGGRGRAPIWGIAYGAERAVLAQLPSTRRGVELLPALHALQAALAAIPGPR